MVELTVKDEEVYGRNLDLGPPLQGKTPSKSQINRGYDLIQNYFSNLRWGAVESEPDVEYLARTVRPTEDAHNWKTFSPRTQTQADRLMAINLGLCHRHIRPDFSSNFIDCRKYENVFGVGGLPGQGCDPAKCRVSRQPAQERLKCKHID